LQPQEQTQTVTTGKWEECT